MQSLNGRKLIVSEEGLLSEVGHWFEYCKAVVEINQQQGVSCTVAAHADASTAVRTELPYRGVYSRTSWGTINTETNPLKRHSGTLRHNVTVYTAMSRLLSETGPVDVVFAPTVTIQHILGWRLFAARHLGKSVGRLVLLIRNTVAHYDKGSQVPQFKKSAQLLALAIRSFKKYELEGRYTFATDSERLADEYEALSGCRPVVFPSPRISPSSDASARLAKSGEVIVFASLGPARLEKGIDVLQAAIAKVLAKGASGSAHFVIQWNMPIADASGQIIHPDAAVVSNERVRFLTEDLSSEEYLSELLNSDCLVLPYRHESYFARISGVAVEAATAGIPMIYTRGTWCEDLVTSAGAGIGVPDGDADALAGALAEMTENIHMYRAAARDAAAKARALHTPDSFLQLLWG